MWGSPSWAEIRAPELDDTIRKSLKERSDLFNMLRTPPAHCGASSRSRIGGAVLPAIIQHYGWDLALLVDAEAIFPCRNSSPVSRIALSSAGQSSKSVAKIFWTMRCVSSGTKRFSVTGEYPTSSARRAQYKLPESHDSASRRLEYPEKAGNGPTLISSRA